MARASSVISVSIIGDAKKLIGATQQADAATGGLVKSAARLFVGTVAVSKAFEFMQDSTKEADRLGDALTRLNIQLGPDFTRQLDKTASGFVDIGASKQDILELEANFADLGTTIGLTNTNITETAPKVAAVATAISLLEDVDPSSVIEQIGKAANGSAKAALALGVSLLDNVDPATQLSNILSQLDPKLQAVTSGTKDLEQQQRTLDAQIETLQANLGGPLSDALATVLGWINNIVADIPQLVDDLSNLGGAFEDFGRAALGPLGNVRDALEGILNLFDQSKNSGATFHVNTQRITDRSVADAIARDRAANGLGR